MFDRQTNNLDVAVQADANVYLTNLQPSSSAAYQVTLTDLYVRFTFSSNSSGRELRRALRSGPSTKRSRTSGRPLRRRAPKNESQWARGCPCSCESVGGFWELPISATGIFELLRCRLGSLTFPANNLSLGTQRYDNFTSNASFFTILHPAQFQNLVEFIEYLFYKVNEALNSMDSLPSRGHHRLARFQHRIRDKYVRK